MSKSIIFLVKSFWAICIDIGNFFWPHCRPRPMDVTFVPSFLDRLWWEHPSFCVLILRTIKQIFSGFRSVLLFFLSTNETKNEFLQNCVEISFVRSYSFLEVTKSWQKFQPSEAFSVFSSQMLQSQKLVTFCCKNFIYRLNRPILLNCILLKNGLNE